MDDTQVDSGKEGTDEPKPDTPAPETQVETPKEPKARKARAPKAKKGDKAAGSTFDQQDKGKLFDGSRKAPRGK